MSFEWEIVPPPTLMAEVPEAGLGGAWIDVEVWILLLAAGLFGKLAGRPGALGHTRSDQAPGTWRCLRQPATHSLPIFHAN